MSDRLVVMNGNQTTVASSASSVTVLAQNSNRRGAAIFNDSTQVLYLLLASTVAGVAGTAASTSNYTVQLASNAYYELPNTYIYTGIIYGIWASANGNARVTEWS